MTMMPAASDFTGASITEAQFKTALTTLRTFLYEKLGDDGSVAIQAFPSGTAMLFAQTAAPTGWTKSTTHNDKTLRVVSGTASSGGSVAFSTVFGRTATDGHALSVSEMPSHTHAQAAATMINMAGIDGYTGTGTGSIGGTTGAAGSGGSHSHNLDIRVQYVDVIIATKDA